MGKKVKMRRVSKTAQYRRYTRSKAGNFFFFAFLTIAGLCSVVPLFYCVITSLKPLDELLIQPPRLWVPKNLSWDPMKEAIEKMNLPTSLWSTLKLEVVSALISTATCGVAAYGMARFKFRGRGVLNFILLLTILVPASIVIIPNYMNFYDFNPLGIVHLIEKIFHTDLETSLLGTVWTLWLPSLTGVGIRAGFYIYIASLMSLLLIMGLAACGGGGNEGSSAPIESSQSEVSAPEFSAPESSAPESDASGTTTSGNSTTTTTTKRPLQGNKKAATWDEIKKQIPAGSSGKELRVDDWNPTSEVPGMANVNKKFTEETGIKINYTIVTYASYFTKIAAEVASKSAPDAVRI